MYVQDIVLLAIELVAFVPVVGVRIREQRGRGVELYGRDAVRAAFLAQLLQLSLRAIFIAC